MEHPCDKCGVNIEDGTAFCPQCGSPQIRVVTTGVATQPNTSATGIDLSSPSYGPPIATPLQWTHALSSAMFALLAALLLIFLLGAPPGLAMLAAGFLSVILYRRRSPLAHLTVGLGFRVGALSGLLGFVTLLAGLGIAAAFRSSQEVHNAILKYVQEYAARTGDPKMQDVLALFNTPGGFALLVVLSLFLTCIAFLLFSGLGGVLGAALLRRKDRLQ